MPFIISESDAVLLWTMQPFYLLWSMEKLSPHCWVVPLIC